MDIFYHPVFEEGYISMLIQKKLLLSMFTLLILGVLAVAKPASATPFNTRAYGSDTQTSPTVVGWYHHHRHHHHHSGIVIHL
jgi:hypothetical protein